MSIQVATQDDFETIRTIWKQNEKVLSIPYKVLIQEGLDAKQWYLLREQDKVIGMIMIKVLKKKPIVWIKHFCIIEECRGKGFGSFLMKNALQRVAIPENYEIQVECKDGAENNRFYNKFSSKYDIIPKKSLTLRRYHISLEAVCGKTCQKKLI